MSHLLLVIVPSDKFKQKPYIHLFVSPMGGIDHILCFFICRRMQGKGLEGLNYKELQQLEHELHEGILSVRDRKVIHVCMHMHLQFLAITFNPLVCVQQCWVSDPDIRLKVWKLLIWNIGWNLYTSVRVSNVRNIDVNKI